MVCSQQTHFRSSLQPPFENSVAIFGGREATTGNASAIRRLATSVSRFNCGDIFFRDVMILLRIRQVELGSMCHMIDLSYA